MATSLRRRDDSRGIAPVSGEPRPKPTAGAVATSNRHREPLFRPRSRSRVRLLSGIALLAAAVVVNLAVYRRLDERVPVLQLTRDLPAGARITEGDLRQVEASTSSDINVVPAAELNSILGDTAKVRLVAGSLLVHQQIQPNPLVAAGASVVALTFPNGELPAGLRERSQVALVLISGQSTTVTTTSVSARVVTLPTPLAGQSDRLTMSFEVAATDAANVAAAERVRVILIDPGNDPVYASSTTSPLASPTSAGTPTPSVDSSATAPSALPGASPAPSGGSATATVPFPIVTAAAAAAAAAPPPTTGADG